MLLGIADFEYDVVEVPTGDARAWLGRGREVARHSGIRSEQVIVVRAAIVRVLFFLLQDSDDRVRHALDQHCRTNRGLAGEELPVGFGAENEYTATVALIIVGNQAAFGNLKRAEVLVRRPNANHSAVGGVVLTDLGDSAAQFRANVLDRVTLVPNQDGVVDVEFNFAAGSASADLRTSASAPQDDEILAQRLHVLFLVDAEAASQPHQQNHGRNPPNDPEHRQESSHLVSPEGGERLAQDFRESHGLGPLTAEGGRKAIRPRMSDLVHLEAVRQGKRLNTQVRTLLLQDDLVAFFQSAQHFGLGTVGNP